MSKPDAKKPNAEKSDLGVENNTIPALSTKSRSKTILYALGGGVLICGVASIAFTLAVRKPTEEIDNQSTAASRIQEFVAPSRRTIENEVPDSVLYRGDAPKSDVLARLENEAILNGQSGLGADASLRDRVIQAVQNDIGGAAGSTANNPVSVSVAPQPTQQKPQQVPQPARSRLAGPTPEELLAMQLCSSLDGSSNVCGQPQSQAATQARSGTAVTTPQTQAVDPQLQAITAMAMQQMRQPTLQGGNGARSNLIDDDQAWAELNASRSTDVSVAYSTGNRELIVGEGKLMRVTLRQAISSELAGDLSGIVTNDIYADAGRRVLIPRGSLAFGEYRSGASAGESRIYAIWQKIRMPDGTEVIIDSNMTDDLGRSGVSGFVDRHYIERFASSAALSFIGNIAMGATADQDLTTQTTVTLRESIAAIIEDITREELTESQDIENTIYVNQGETIQIYINRDLDFSGVRS